MNFFNVQFLNDYNRTMLCAYIFLFKQKNVCAYINIKLITPDYQSEHICLIEKD